MGGRIWHVGVAGRRAADGAHHGAAIDRDVQRLAHALVVERRHARIEEQRDVAGPRLDVRLGGVLGEELAQPLREHTVGHGVRLPAQDGIGVARLRDVEAQLDAVGVAVGLRGLRPLAKARVAGQHEPVTELVAGHHVWARGGHGPDVGGAGWRPGGQDEGEVQRELVEELGVGASEVEGDDRVVGGLGDDAAREVAGPGFPRALRGADDTSEEPGAR